MSATNYWLVTGIICAVVAGIGITAIALSLFWNRGGDSDGEEDGAQSGDATADAGGDFGGQGTPGVQAGPQQGMYQPQAQSWNQPQGQGYSYGQDPMRYDPMKADPFTASPDPYGMGTGAAQGQHWGGAANQQGYNIGGQPQEKTCGFCGTIVDAYVSTCPNCKNRIQ